MKRIIIALLFMVLIPFYAQAWQEECTDLSETADIVMSLRQIGISAADIINGLGPYVDEEERELFYDIVLIAYHTPIQDTEEGRQRAINDYKDLWFLSCAEILRNISLGDDI